MDNVEQIEQAVAVFVREHGQIIIADNEQFKRADDLRREVKRQLKAIEDVLDPFRKTAYDAYQSIMERIKKNKSPLEGLEKKIVAEQKRFLAEQDRLRIEAERKAREAQAEADRKAKAERDRLERERLEAAATLERAGDQKGAEAVLETALKVEQDVPVPAPFIAQVVTAPEVDRRTFRKVWKARVTDLRALCLAVGNGIAPVNIIEVRAGELNRYAVATHGGVKVPGVEFYQE